MSKPTLRIVRADDMLAVPVSEASDAVRVETEYRRALLLLDISHYECDHGPNAYTRYVRKYGKRPPPAEARAMALVMGKRVKAADGRWYPKKTAADRRFDQQQRALQEAASVRCERSSKLRQAIAVLANMDISPEEIDLIYLDGREIETKLPAAISWLNRFAMLRLHDGQDACPEDAYPRREADRGTA